MQAICHSSTDVRIWVLVSREGERKEDSSGRSQLAEKNSGEDQTRQYS